MQSYEFVGGQKCGACVVLNIDQGATFYVPVIEELSLKNGSTIKFAPPNKDSYRVKSDKLVYMPEVKDEA